MKITSTGVPALPATTPAQEALPAHTTPSPLSAKPQEHQSAVLQTAQAALHSMPEIDEAKVAALRDALARGEVKFDAGKLAGLIARYHGVRE